MSLLSHRTYRAGAIAKDATITAIDGGGSATAPASTTGTPASRSRYRMRSAVGPDPSTAQGSA